jgi:glycosyltransferase involved in cell wall biosynthesis
VSHKARLSIALFMSTFEAGGTERQMIELIRRLDRSRWSIHVASFRSRGQWFDRVAEAAESLAVFPTTSLYRTSTAAAAWRFGRWCRNVGISVVHAAELPANIFALPAAALAGVPVRVANRREINPDKSALQIAAQRIAYGCAHVIVANSQAAAARLRSEHVPGASIRIVPNGIDLDRFGQDRHSSAAPRRVLVVANLRPEKGHDVLLDAAPIILRQFPDARFEIVGDGPEREFLVARASTLGVADAFSFSGHCDDVAERLRAGDVFVLPSRSEAFPNAVLEAMAAGLPVVASGVGGLLELVTDQATGLLVPPGDARALANAICRLMADPPLAHRLGAAARAEVHGRYSFDRMVAAFEQIYLDLLAERRVIAAQPARGRADARLSPPRVA